MNNIYKTIYNEIKKYKTIYIARHIILIKNKNALKLAIMRLN